MADIAEVMTLVTNGSVAEPTGGAAATGDTIPTSTGKETVVVNNGSAASINVTVPSNELCNQGVDHDLVVAVAAGAKREIGPFSPPSRWKNATTGKIEVNYSAVTSVTRYRKVLP